MCSTSLLSKPDDQLTHLQYLKMSEHSVIGIMSKKILGKNPENYFLIEAGRTYTNKNNLTFFCPSFCT